MRLICLGILAVALGTAPAQAQSGGGYSMRSSAIGAAGGPASGGGYDLHGVGGLTGGLQEGGAYSLFGGFPPSAAGGPVDAGPVDPVPLAFRLRAPVPSPFRDQVAIGFELPDARHVSVLVHAIDGRRVLKLVDAHYGAGRHRVLWNGKDDAGRTVGSGMYFVHVIAGTASATQRLVRVQ